jgi:hypothetical protein
MNYFTLNNGTKFDICFLKGTAVACKGGLKPIEEVLVGDYVLSRDETTGQVGYKEVLRTFRNMTERVTLVSVSGEVIYCTPEHPFRVASDGYSMAESWVQAESLIAGQMLLRSNGGTAQVEWVTTQNMAADTYNFEVADWHTYHVGREMVLVHNYCNQEFIEYCKNRGIPLNKDNGTSLTWTQVSQHLKGQADYNGLNGLSKGMIDSLAWGPFTFYEINRTYGNDMHTESGVTADYGFVKFGIANSNLQGSTGGAIGIIQALDIIASRFPSTKGTAEKIVLAIQTGGIDLGAGGFIDAGKTNDTGKWYIRINSVFNAGSDTYIRSWQIQGEANIPYSY